MTNSHPNPHGNPHVDIDQTVDQTATVSNEQSNSVGDIAFTIDASGNHDWVKFNHSDITFTVDLTQSNDNQTDVTQDADLVAAKLVTKHGEVFDITQDVTQTATVSSDQSNTVGDISFTVDASGNHSHVMFNHSDITFDVTVDQSNTNSTTVSQNVDIWA